MFRRLLLALFLICVGLPVYAGGAANTVAAVTGGPPAWVPLPGQITVSLDPYHARAWQQGYGNAIDDLVTVVAASTRYQQFADGSFGPVPSGRLRWAPDVGATIWEARTNSIRNNSMQGAVPGTPGTLPTNWSEAIGATGIHFNVVGFGTDSGIDYVDLRLNGTPAATLSIQLLFDGPTQIAATNGQTWSYSIFFSLVAGTTTNLPSWQGGWNEESSAPAFLGQHVVGLTTNSTPLSRNRQVFTAANSNASTATIQPFLKVSVTSGSPVDATIRIGWPELEFGAFASPPCRTIIGAQLCAADTVTLTHVPTFGSGLSVVVAGTPAAPSSFATDQVAAHIDDGSGSNRFYLSRGGSSNNAQFVYTVAGSSTVVTNSGWGQNVFGKEGVSGQAGTQAQFLNAGTVGTGSGAGFPAGLANVRLGSNQGGGAQFDGSLASFYLAPAVPLANAALQARTQ